MKVAGKNDESRNCLVFRFFFFSVVGTQIELTRSDVMDYPVLSGNWQINTDQQDPLKKFSIYTNCSHEKINRDLTYQIYEDGRGITANVFLFSLLKENFVFRCFDSNICNTIS